MSCITLGLNAKKISVLWDAIFEGTAITGRHDPPEPVERVSAGIR